MKFASDSFLYCLVEIDYDEYDYLIIASYQEDHFCPKSSIFKKTYVSVTMIKFETLTQNTCK